MLPELAEARQKRKQAVQELRDKTLNPFLRSIGYKGNAQDQINDISKNVDFGSKDSIRNAVREMAQIDSNLAANWVRQNEKTIKLLEEPGIDYSQLRTKQLIDKETLEGRANQLVGLVGTPTDYDSAVKVLKILDAQGLTGTDRYKGLKQDLRSYQEKIGATVTDAYRSSVADKADEMIKFPGFDSFFGGKTLPKIANYDYWNNEDNLADFVAGYSKAFKQDPAFVIREILEGRIDPNKGYAPAGSASTTQAPKSNINNSSGFVPNFDLNKPFN